MVAETLSAPKRGKIGGVRQTVPLPVKLKIRSLYIIQQLSPAEIGEKMGMTRQQVQGVVYREKWQREKQRVKLALQQKADARAQDEIAEIHDAFAIKTEELAMGTLDKAAKRMPNEDENVARDLQALSQTAKNFVGIARQIRGMDLAKRDNASGATVVFVQCERVTARTERNVTPPAIEIQAAPESPKLT